MAPTTENGTASRTIPALTADFVFVYSKTKIRKSVMVSPRDVDVDASAA